MLTRERAAALIAHTDETALRTLWMTLGHVAASFEVTEHEAYTQAARRAARRAREQIWQIIREIPSEEIADEALAVADEIFAREQAAANE